MNKKNDNIMEMIPNRKKNIEWTKENEIITLIIKRENKLDKFINKIFRTPDKLTVELEEFGSFIWEKCDGNTNIYEISESLEEYFGDKVKPVIPRLLEYL